MLSRRTILIFEITIRCLYKLSRPTFQSLSLAYFSYCPGKYYFNKRNEYIFFEWSMVIVSELENSEEEFLIHFPKFFFGKTDSGSLRLQNGIWINFKIWGVFPPMSCEQLIFVLVGDA